MLSLKKCKFCNVILKDKVFENKIGLFCNEVHFEKYLESLTNEEYVELQNNFCVCSDE